MTTEVTPYSSTFFSQIREEAKAIQAEIKLIDKMRQKRKKIFEGCLRQYQKYLKSENELLDRNTRHCEGRNDWFKEEVNKSWRIVASNRQLILRSISRTNVLKRDVDQWLNRICQQPAESNIEHSYDRQSVRQSLEGSRLIDKYNQIVAEYGHKI